MATAQEAAARVPDGATVLVDGSGGGVNEPGAILAALEARFLAEGHPNGLTLLHVSGMGDGNGGGTDRFAKPGMVRRVIGGHWGWSSAMQALAVDEQIEAYCLPQGTLSHLLREIAAGRPGVVSTVGLDTFVDPRLEGGRLNDKAEEDLVHLIDIAGREHLFVPSFPIEVAIIRGTYADADGNISMDQEGLLAETLSAAQAARNSGGIVLAQVRELVPRHHLDPRRVRVPGILVDELVVEPTQRLSAATAMDPAKVGEARATDAEHEPMAHDVRKVIARRAALELRQGDVVNLGFGMPDGVAAVLAEEGRTDDVTFTVEQGHVGGTPVGGSDFGLCINPSASIDAGHQFDWYDGGGLDIAVLSFAQLDRSGNVNVGKFGGRIPGVGGFINISQGASRLVFVGTFVAGGHYTLEEDGRLALPSDGIPKIVEAVDQISFSGARAAALGQPVTYVTERAVFELSPSGLRLTEIAPEADLRADVLDLLPFEPLVAERLRTMEPRVFTAEQMKLRLKGVDVHA